MEDEADALRKVDAVSECIKLLATSSDTSSLDAADKLLKKLDNDEEELKTKDNRTLINSVNSSHGDTTQSAAVQQDAFLREIERDAAERAQRREANRKRAAEWKDRGNEQFKMANYAKAVDCYTRGLDIAKDFELLYQNRANCYVKLGRFAEALADAESAIFLTGEKSAKPFFHQARALTGLDRFDEAGAAYRRMAACPDAAPGHADRCSAELERLVSARADEARAIAEFKDSSSSSSQNNPPGFSEAVDLLIYRLARGDQPLAYYAAGMRCLAGALTAGTASARVLFRAKSGFNLLGKQAAVVGALETPLAEMSEEQVDLLVAALTLCAAVAADDAENCHRVLQLPALSARALDAVMIQPAGAAAPAAAAAAAAARQPALDALTRVSAFACDRLCSLDGLPDPAALVAALLGHVQRQALRQAATSAGLLERLSGSQQLRDRLQRAPAARLTFLSSAVEALLTAGSADSLPAFVDATDSVRRLMAGCPALRAAFAGRRAFLTACEAAVERYAVPAAAEAAGETADGLQQSALASVLGLLACGALEPTPAVSGRAPHLAAIALRFASAASASPEARQFALAVLASLAPRDVAVAGPLGSADAGGGGSALPLLAGVLDCPGNPGVASALRVLAAALGANADARRCVGDDPRWLDRLLELAHSSSDCVLGNATLCLSRCLEDTAAAELLARTDIVRLLLCRMRECKDKEAKANCAVLCGKLAQSHHGHRDRLRELDGVNILNSTLVTNNIKL